MTISDGVFQRTTKEWEAFNTPFNGPVSTEASIL